MIICVRVTLFLSWFCHFTRIFEDWIGFRSNFLVAISYTVSLLICGLLQISVVSCLRLLFWVNGQNARIVTDLDYCRLRLVPAVRWSAFSFCGLLFLLLTHLRF